MLTPNEIANKTFEKVKFSGYRPEDVDIFMQEAASAMAALQAEKNELEAKIEVLADKVEEYRSDEDSLRAALIGAQKLGDSIVKESKNKAELIMRDAQIKAERIVEAAQHKTEKEQYSLHLMQTEVKNFKEKLLSLYKAHLELITALPDFDDEKPEVAINLGEPQTETEAPEADKSAVPEDKEQAPQAEPVMETVPAMEEEAEEDEFIIKKTGSTFKPDYHADLAQGIQELSQQPGKGESKFGPLKFGAGFDLTRDSDK
ncbi:DivIVA domain-containing protein [Zongyangia hominis]|uniref:DivIVA domain-containing protein n=1 Tax=Zongyangia hominis TaxID=2763677 RepID=A0A926ECC3_9FIRM|nr:DivIVA domain-containing protein [Zongyangia hominis]MBC8569634.1 DivIVA domain-containing protein [Zongyangia hominis]